MSEAAVREFEVREGSTAAAWYYIEVHFQGKLVDRFVHPTMRGAQDEFERAGYKRVSQFLNDVL